MYSMYKIYILFFLFFINLTQQVNSQIKVKEKNNKLVIAHRGASGYLPEHTIESKVMAYAMNVDFIEQDLVLSKDDVPIVIHDIYLDDVTNITSKFPNRSREDGRFYVIDFSYEELIQLTVYERFNPKTKEQIFPDRFPLSEKSNFKLHSLQDEIELIQGLNKSTGNNIGIYPEIKNPEFHRKNGKDISLIVLKILNNYGYKTKTDNCILQCFDVDELKRIRNDLKSKLFLTQLIGTPGQEELLNKYATYADAVGPRINLLIAGYDQEEKIIISNLVKNAHDLGLKVHAFTFRADHLGEFTTFNNLLEFGFYKANVDGIFTDFPDKAIEFLKEN
ncbi:MAG: glycerophosphodiester phosphodiesterase [Bacteroidota bacterium]